MKNIWIIFCLLIFFAGSAVAKTPDGLTPAEETVCDEAGLTGASRGLCNAYCEAMDCDSESPKASAKACEKVGANFVKKSKLPVIPCEDDLNEIECPCFDEADLVLANELILLNELELYCTVDPDSGYYVGWDADAGTNYVEFYAQKSPDFKYCYYLNDLTTPPIYLNADEISSDQADACNALISQFCPGPFAIVSQSITNFNVVDTSGCGAAPYTHTMSYYFSHPVDLEQSFPPASCIDTNNCTVAEINSYLDATWVENNVLIDLGQGLIPIGGDPSFNGVGASLAADRLSMTITFTNDCYSFQLGDIINPDWIVYSAFGVGAGLNLNAFVVAQ